LNINHHGQFSNLSSLREQTGQGKPVEKLGDADFAIAAKAAAAKAAADKN
jgi:hypothetical protein